LDNSKEELSKIYTQQKELHKKVTRLENELRIATETGTKLQADVKHYMLEIEQKSEASVSQSNNTKHLQNQIQQLESNKIELLKIIEESNKSAEEIALLKRKYEDETHCLEEDLSEAKLQATQLQAKLDELQLQSPRLSRMEDSLLSEIVETLPPTGDAIQGIVNFTAIQEKNLKIEEEKLKIEQELKRLQEHIKGVEYDKTTALEQQRILNQNSENLKIQLQESQNSIKLLQDKLLEQQHKETEYQKRLQAQETINTAVSEYNELSQKLKDEIKSLQEELKRQQLNNIEYSRQIGTFNERELLKQREIDQIVINKNVLDQQLHQAQKKSNELEQSQLRALAELEDKKILIDNIQKKMKELEYQNIQLQAAANRSASDSNEPVKQPAIKRSFSSPAKEITWEASKNKTPAAFDDLHDALKTELANGEDPSTVELDTRLPSNKKMRAKLKKKKQSFH